MFVYQQKYTTPSLIYCNVFRQNEHLTTKNIVLSRQRKNSLSMGKHNTIFVSKNKNNMKKYRPRKRVPLNLPI